MLRLFFLENSYPTLFHAVISSRRKELVPILFYPFQPRLTDIFAFSCPLGHFYINPMTFSSCKVFFLFLSSILFLFHFHLFIHFLFSPLNALRFNCPLIRITIMVNNTNSHSNARMMVNNELSYTKSWLHAIGIFRLSVMYPCINRRW